MIVRLENIRKSFQTPEGETHTVLALRNLEVPEGAQWVITGESGSGKTTFLNVIGGILLPDEGTVEVADVMIHELSEARRDRFRAEKIGFVFQQFNLLQGFTALENVLMGMLFSGRVDRAGAQGLLDRVGLASRMNYRPEELSVGQQQRVAIARALANKPRIILADEPTGNLDPKSGQGVIDLLKEMCNEGGQTLLVVTHQPQVMDAFEDVKDMSEFQRKIA